MDFMDDQLPKEVSKPIKRFERNQLSFVQYKGLPPFPFVFYVYIGWL